jgi:hypothetical protein
MEAEKYQGTVIKKIQYISWGWKTVRIGHPDNALSVCMVWLIIYL